MLRYVMHRLVSAAGVVVLVSILVFTIIQFRFQRRWVFYG